MTRRTYRKGYIISVDKYTKWPQVGRSLNFHTDSINSSERSVRGKSPPKLIVPSTTPRVKGSTDAFSIKRRPLCAAIFLFANYNGSARCELCTIFKTIMASEPHFTTINSAKESLYFHVVIASLTLNSKSG